MRLFINRIVGTAAMVLLLAVGAAYLLWTGFADSRAGVLLGGLFLVALMAYTIVQTPRTEVRARKGIPRSRDRDVHELGFWLRFAAAVDIIVLAYGVWYGIPVVAGLLLVLNLGLVVGWLLLLRRASPA